MSGVEEGGLGAAAAPAPAPAAKPSAAAIRSAARASFEAAKQKGAAAKTAAQDAAQPYAAAAQEQGARAAATAEAELAARPELQAHANAARAQAEAVAAENAAMMRANAAAAKQLGSDLQEMSELPAPALQAVAASTAARAEAQYAQNRALVERNRDAALQMKATAEQAALEQAARAAQAGGAALQRGEQMASVAVDIARGEFEARWEKAVAEENRLRELALEIERREKQVSLLRSATEPNWPAIRCCCIEPVVHHDILGDIPVERQSFMRKAYINYFLTCFMVTLNMALAISMQFIQNEKDEKTQKEKVSNSNMLQHSVVAIVIMVLGIPFAFVVWYWPTYKALGTGVSSQYLAAWAGLIVAFLFNLLCILGPIGYGGCGIFFAIEVKDTKTPNAFIPVIILALLWIFQEIFYVYMMWRLRRHQLQDRASLAKAKAEMFAGNVRAAVTGH